MTQAARKERGRHSGPSWAAGVPEALSENLNDIGRIAGGS